MNKYLNLINSTAEDIKVIGRIVSVANDGVVASAYQIWDDYLHMWQGEINKLAYEYSMKHEKDIEHIYEQLDGIAIGGISDIILNGTRMRNGSDVIVDLGTVIRDLSNYYTKNETYNKEEVQSLVDRLPKMTIIKVDVLPEDPSQYVEDIVLVPASPGEENNYYDEYIVSVSETEMPDGHSRLNYAWEKIGTTKVDLSNYVTIDYFINNISKYKDIVSIETNQKSDTALRTELPDASLDTMDKLYFVYSFEDVTTPDKHFGAYITAYNSDLEKYEWINVAGTEIYAIKQHVYSKLESDYLINAETQRAQLAEQQLNTTKANKSDLATVAISGSYNDLSNKPTIPTVPTNVSAFTNDAGYLTEHQSLSNYITNDQLDERLLNNIIYGELIDTNTWQPTILSDDEVRDVIMTGGGQTLCISGDSTESLERKYYANLVYRDNVSDGSIKQDIYVYARPIKNQGGQNITYRTYKITISVLGVNYSYGSDDIGG